MRTTRFRYRLAAQVLTWTLLVSPTTAHAEEILISAAASLTDVLREIASAYQLQSKHVVRFNFGPSSGLARQIDEGAPADIFFSADLPQMDNLDKKGHFEPGTRSNLLSNQLVIIVPANSTLKLAAPNDLLKADVKRIALAEPSSVPAGVYSAAYLRHEGLWERIKSKIVPVQDVRATLVAVESGNVEAGFVYKTDAFVSKRVKIIYEVPLDKGPQITYPIAIVKESKRKEAARGFLAFVRNPIATGAFKKYGFVVLD